MRKAGKGGTATDAASEDGEPRKLPSCGGTRDGGTHSTVHVRTLGFLGPTFYECQPCLGIFSGARREARGDVKHGPARSSERARRGRVPMQMGPRMGAAKTVNTASRF